MLHCSITLFFLVIQLLNLILALFYLLLKLRILLLHLVIYLLRVLQKQLNGFKPAVFFVIKRRVRSLRRLQLAFIRLTLLFLIQELQLDVFDLEFEVLLARKQLLFKLLAGVFQVTVLLLLYLDLFLQLLQRLLVEIGLVVLQLLDEVLDLAELVLDQRLVLHVLLLVLANRVPQPVNYLLLLKVLLLVEIQLLAQTLLEIRLFHALDLKL